MEALNASVAELVAIIAGLIAIYFFVALVVNLAQAQLSYATGDSIGHAHALQQSIAMVVLFAVAASSKFLVPALQGMISPDKAPQSGQEALAVWRGIASFVVSVVVGGVGIFTTLSAVYAGLGAQAHLMAGTPGGVARSLTRFIVLIGGGVLSLCSVFLANWLIEKIL
jgi:hypothetical protein